MDKYFIASFVFMAVIWVCIAFNRKESLKDKWTKWKWKKRGRPTVRVTHNYCKKCHAMEMLDEPSLVPDYLAARSDNIVRRDMTWVNQYVCDNCVV